jgi:DNA-binding NtrC family response regulator
VSLAATNRDLERDVAAGQFREDLFYRLHVFTVDLPPLPERGDDVLLLADHFVRTLGPRMGKGDPGLSREAREALVSHAWPGNIRELQNAVERALIMSEGGLITAAQLGITRRKDPHGDAAAPDPSSPARPAPVRSLADWERQMVLDALETARGNKSRAAGILGLTRSQLYTRLNTIAGIDELRSVSTEGVSQIFIQFQLEKNIDVAAQEVRDKINQILPDLPQNMQPWRARRHL